MKKRMEKCLTILLSIMLILNMMPSFVLADDEIENTPVETNETNEIEESNENQENLIEENNPVMEIEDSSNIEEVSQDVQETTIQETVVLEDLPTETNEEVVLEENQEAIVEEVAEETVEVKEEQQQEEVIEISEEETEVLDEEDEVIEETLEDEEEISDDIKTEETTNQETALLEDVLTETKEEVVLEDNQETIVEEVAEETVEVQEEQQQEEVIEISEEETVTLDEEETEISEEETEVLDEEDEVIEEVLEDEEEINEEETETLDEEEDLEEESESLDEEENLEEEVLEEESEEEQEEELVPFEESQTIDGVIISVKAEEGTFPKDSTLSIRKVDIIEEAKVEEAIQEQREDNKKVASSYTFDIKVLDKEGNEIQPKEGKKVEVLFSIKEIANENLDTTVYHINEDTLSSEELKVEENGQTAIVETDGFSYYTVEFTYNHLEYVIEGGSEVPLSTILSSIGLSGTITNAVSSNPSLFTVDNNSGEWILKSLQAFDTHETLKVTIDGIEYVVEVTDSQHSHPSGSHGESGAWIAWNDSSNLPTASNNYYLNTDVTRSRPQIPSSGTANIKLCLNGHKITLSGGNNGLYDTDSSRKVNLTIYDSDDNSGIITNTSTYGVVIRIKGDGSTYTLAGGKITNCNCSTLNTPVYVDAGTFTMKGGMICNNTLTDFAPVYVVNNGTFNMSGGTITGNTNKKASGVVASGVHVTSGTFNMSGGSITNNNSPDANSAVGVYLQNSGLFNVKGKVTITGNTSKGKDLNVLVARNKTIGINGNLDSDSRIGVTTATAPSGSTTIQFTNGLSGKGSKTNFISDNPDYAVMIKNNEAHLIAHKHEFEYSADGDTITATCVNIVTDCPLDDRIATIKLLPPALKVYGGSGSEKATIEGEIPGVTLPNIIYCDGPEETTTAPKNAGQYFAKITLGESPFEATAEISYTIAKADIAPVVTINDWNYGETPSAPSVTSGNPGGGTVTYKYYTDEACTTETGTNEGASTSGGVPSKAGNYWVKATVTETDNYKSGTGTKGFEIIATEITVTGLSFDSKVYDGTTEAIIDISAAQLEGVAPGDEVTIVSATGTFADKNVGTGKTISNIVIVLGGADADGYIATADSITGAITKKAVVVEGITASNKVYDGNTTATVDTSNATFDGIVGEDKLTVTTTGSFSDKNVGTDKTVAFAALTLGGADVGNYELATTGNQTSTTVDIAPRPVTISGITAQDKVYDGNTEATLVLDNAVINNKVENDDLSFTGSTGTFSDKNVENDKTVTITGVTLSGNDAANYELTSQPEATTADIAPRHVTISSITAQDKTYDGNTDATLVYTDAVLDGKLVNDDLSVSATGTFADKNVGNEKTVTISGLTLTGDAKDNYVLASEGHQETTKASIAKREITVSGIKSEGKTYDGNTDATTSLYYEDAKLIGKVDGEGEYCDDKLGITATGTFPNDDYGVDKVITLAGLTLTGSEMNNYVLAATGQQETCLGDIDKYAVTVTAKNATKAYGENDPEFEYEYTPELVGDDVFEGALSRHVGEDVGEYTITAGTLHDHNHNYAITYNHATLTITQATNTATVSIEGWTYGDEANEPSVDAKFGADKATYTYSNAKEGTYSETVPTDAGTYYVKATIAETTNYKGVVSEAVEFVIAKKVATLSWTDTTFTYDGEEHKPTATVTNLETGDSCNVTVTGE